ncbi:triacylglycerol lipase 2-like [Mercurialis annua]|uniref:triacylglycerol lipase 2-like n=1 Tax=Mercurialis annua TaxID=3986 RepID=UPI00215E9B4C|nr:triacylglycerol lipase 2-like [Mercurialis annua]
MLRMGSSIAVVILFLFSAAAAAGHYKHLDGICKSMVVSQGYLCQEHKVITDDGYVLSMQRLPADSSGSPAYKPPVLLQHGIMSDGSTWLFNDPDEALGFILADNGYDVWISNTRGTRHSQGHTSLCPKDPAYWNWSWDELAAHDLPAMFNYIHNQTAQKIYFVGHSLGTLTMMAALSQDKLLNMTGGAGFLSPIAYLSHTTSSCCRAASDLFLSEEFYWLGLHELIPGGVATTKLLKDICTKPEINCTDIMSAFTGPNCCINSSRTNDFLDHEPQPTATKNAIHLSQMLRTGNIAMYDYGNIIENMEHYNQLTPPAYDLTMIPNDIPLFLAFGEKDMLADLQDVHMLLEKLKYHDLEKLVLLKIEDYAHADFVFGENANEKVYDPLMDFLDSIDEFRRVKKVKA